MTDRRRQRPPTASAVFVLPDPPPTEAPTAGLAQLYAEHHPFVWRSARRLGASPDIADDVVQEVFLVVSRRLADFEGRSSIRTWLFGITMRVRAAMLRRESRHQRRIAAVPSPREDRPVDETQAKLDLLDRLLAELDEAQRAVFILVELEGMTAVEIAQEVGAPVNTVYSRLRLARKQMRRAARRHQARARSEETRS